MDNPNIKTLNEILKGEHMAIHAIGEMITKIQDPQLRQELYQMQRQHKENAMLISDRIIELDGHPEDNTGLTGVMADMMIRFQSTLHPHPHYILEKLLEGESQGISAAQEEVKGDLDRYSAELIQQVLSQDHKTMDRLKTLVQKYQ